RAEWPPGGASSTTCGAFFRSHRTRCCSSATKPPAHAGARCSRGPPSSSFTPSPGRGRRADSTSARTPHQPTTHRRGLRSHRASVEHSDGITAHADYAEIVAWLDASRLTPRQVFVTHGEPGPADALRRRLRDAFGWNVAVPEQGASYTLDAPS